MTIVTIVLRLWHQSKLIIMPNTYDYGYIMQVNMCWTQISRIMALPMTRQVWTEFFFWKRLSVRLFEVLFHNGIWMVPLPCELIPSIVKRNINAEIRKFRIGKYFDGGNLLNWIENSDRQDVWTHALYVLCIRHVIHVLAMMRAYV